MKHCPHCDQVLDDDNDFCPNDGARLDANSYFTPTRVVRRQETPVLQPRSSSPLLYLIIGCLTTALVAGGLYAVMSGDKPEFTDQQGAAASPSPAAETSATAAAPTPVPTMPPNISPTLGNAQGKWNGEWSTASGALYGLQVDLDSDENDGIAGQIVWTLRRTPRPDKQSKIGMSATEYVTGRFDPVSRTVRLKGHSKNDPAGLLVMLDEYRLNLSVDNRRLAGQARNGGKWNGIVNLSR